MCYADIIDFGVINPEISPEELGKKFCRLDINMTANGQKLDLELQIFDEGNYPERSLFYWAREYSTGIDEGQDYALLPRTIVISILGFNQFPDPEKFHHEFQCLENRRRVKENRRNGGIVYERSNNGIPPCGGIRRV